MENNFNRTVGIYTLGCKVNQYESEAIAELLEANGISVIAPSSVCDAYIINTCTVTAESDRKARQFIRRAIAKNPSAYIIVTGCLAQTAPDDIAKIEVMLSASVAELLSILSPYAVLNEQPANVVYELNMPANWKSGRADNLLALCRNYLLHSLLARWLDFIKADSAALYRTLNNENAAAILHILSLREKPRRG